MIPSVASATMIVVQGYCSSVYILPRDPISLANAILNISSLNSYGRSNHENFASGSGEAEAGSGNRSKGTNGQPLQLQESHSCFGIVHDYRSILWNLDT